MSLSLQNLRDELRSTVGLDEDDADNVQVDRWLNLSWWELQDKVRFREKEGVLSFNTIIGTNSYILEGLAADFESTEQLVVTYENQNYPIRYRDHNTLLDKLNTDTNARGMPEEYYRLGGNLLLYPIPDKVYTLTLKYRKTLADIQAGGVSVPQSWHEFILLGGIMRAYRNIGEMNRAMMIRAERDSLALTMSDVEAREKSDLRLAGVRLLQNRYR